MAFTKNRERLPKADEAYGLLKEVVREMHCRRVLPAEHFTVEGALLEAWASHKKLSAARRATTAR